MIPEHAVHPFRRMPATCSDGMSSTNEGMIGFGGRHYTTLIPLSLVSSSWGSLHLVGARRDHQVPELAGEDNCWLARVGLGYRCGNGYTYIPVSTPSHTVPHRPSV